jgi:predicted Zn-ribbon and HTH transcriptional regulator
MKSCPECNSQKIINDVIVLERGDGNANYVLRVAVDEKPEALIFKQRNYSNVRAQVCADCGYIRFFAEFPDTLWSAYQNQQNDV